MLRKMYSNCFCVLLWCKTFRYFTGFQPCSLLLAFGWLWSKMGVAFLGTLKFAISQEWSDEMSWVFACCYKFGKANWWIGNCWVGMLKCGWDFFDHIIWDSTIRCSHKRFDVSSRLIEWFLHWFDHQSTPYLWNLLGVQCSCTC